MTDETETSATETGATTKMSRYCSECLVFAKQHCTGQDNVIATNDVLVTGDSGADTLHDIRATFAYRIA